MIPELAKKLEQFGMLQYVLNGIANIEKNTGKQMSDHDKSMYVLGYTDCFHEFVKQRNERR